MKALTSLLLLITCSLCFASGEPNIIAMSEWSKPLGSNGGHGLRARITVEYGRGAAYAGPWPETQVYLEFQNGSNAVGSPTQFYFDPSNGLSCEMKDANGKTVASGSGSGGGAGVGGSWITLPYDSTIRLRANRVGYGSKPGDGLNLTLSGQTWQLKAGDTNTYDLSCKFTITTPANYVPKDFDAARAVWTGPLELPTMKISVPKK